MLPTEETDEELRETFAHRIKSNQKALLVSQLNYADFNVPEKVFRQILDQLRKQKMSLGEDTELITYNDYVFLFNECRKRPVHQETIEEIFKKLKGGKNLTASNLLSLIQSRRPRATELDILNLLKKYGINYTEHDGILAKQFIELLGRAQFSKY